MRRTVRILLAALMVALFATATVIPAVAATISVNNQGAYVARLAVRYNHDGEIKGAQSGNITPGVTSSLEIPSDATAVSVTVDVATGLAGNPWAPIFSQSLASAVTKKYRVFGTVLNPGWSEVN
jgi:hypothetical protein